MNQPAVLGLSDTALDQAVRHAIEHGELTPAFQPIVHLRGGAVAGFEVLARWHHDVLGTIPPSIFIPVAERLNLIGALTRQIIATACAEAVKWEGKFHLALNISPLHFQDGGMPALFEDAVVSSGFPLNRTEIEITESAIFNDTDAARATLDMLRAKGVGIGLDDFGTGHSSLTRLQTLPFDKLKIDVSFVQSMMESRDSRKIVSAVIGLGQSLGLSIVAEGVETEAQAAILIRLGCDLGQGWLFGRAVPASDVPDLLLKLGQRSGTSDETLDLSTNQRLAQLEAVYASAPVALCFIDRRFRYLNANRRFAELVDVTLEQIVGRTVVDIVPQMEVYVRAAMAQAERRQAIPRHEYPALGNMRASLHSVEAALDEDGELLGLSMAIVDLTERNRLSSMLRDGISHHSGAAGVRRQFQWLADVNGVVYERDPGGEAFTGVNDERVRNGGWMDGIHPDDMAMVRQKWTHAFANGEPINIEFRMRHIDGGWRWMRMRATPRLDGAGTIMHWHGLSEEITGDLETASNLRKLAALVQGTLDITQA